MLCKPEAEAQSIDTKTGAGDTDLLRFAFFWDKVLGFRRTVTVVGREDQMADIAGAGPVCV